MLTPGAVSVWAPCLPVQSRGEVEELEGELRLAQALAEGAGQLGLGAGIAEGLEDDLPDQVRRGFGGGLFASRLHGTSRDRKSARVLTGRVRDQCARSVCIFLRGSGGAQDRQSGVMYRRGERGDAWTRAR